MEKVHELEFTGYYSETGETGLLWDGHEFKFQIYVRGKKVGDIWLEKDTITVADKDFIRALVFEK